MAIGEYRRERYQTTSTARQRSLSWGAIVAGGVLAIALRLMLGLLGLGIGLGGVPGSDRAVTALASTAGIWSIAVALIGLFVGAFAAARLGGVTETLDAVLHGAITWAVATLLVVVLLAGTASAVLGGAFGAIGASIEGLNRAAVAMTSSNGPDNALPDAIRSDLRTILSANSAPQAGDGSSSDAPTDGNDGGAAGSPSLGASQATPTQTIATVASGLSETAGDGEREAAVRAIAEASGLSTEAARQKLATYQQQFDQFVREARQAADDAARTVAASAFSAFVALLLGLVIGSLGGLLGRAGSGRASRDAG